MKIKFKIGRFQFEIFFAWYDIWIGAYIDLRNKTVYIILVPMFPLKICWTKYVDLNRWLYTRPAHFGGNHG